MRTAEERKDPGAVGVDAAEASGVTFHGWGSKTREIGDGKLCRRLSEQFRGRNPTRAENHGNVVVLDIRDGAEGGCGLLCCLIRGLGGLIRHRGNLLCCVQTAGGFRDGARQARIDGEGLGELIDGEPVVHGEGDRVNEFARIGGDDHTASNDV